MKKWIGILGIIIIVLIISGGIFFFSFNNKKLDMRAAISCDEADCFKQKFIECKPATITLKPMENLNYYYEIIGPKEELCEVKSKFTANPNPDWVGKEMTCRYDNLKDFEIAVQDLRLCSGELYDLMTGKTNAQDKLIDQSIGTHLDECYVLTDYDRTTCYINLGRIQMNLSVCDKEFDEEFKWYCYRGVGTGKKDIGICNLILDEKNNNKEWCYERVAFQTGNVSICKLIDYEVDIMNTCYLRVAIEKNDSEICNLIVNENYYQKYNYDGITNCKEKVKEGDTAN